MFCHLAVPFDCLGITKPARSTPPTQRREGFRKRSQREVRLRYYGLQAAYRSKPPLDSRRRALPSERIDQRPPPPPRPLVKAMRLPPGDHGGKYSLSAP